MSLASELQKNVNSLTGLRGRFLRGEPFTEADVRMELSPSTDLRKQLDEAMQLILALTAANQRLRKQHEAVHEITLSADGEGYVHNDDCPACLLEKEGI